MTALLDAPLNEGRHGTHKQHYKLFIEPARDQDWGQRAACKGMDTSIFIPDTDRATPNPEAKQVCEGCPVREACAEHAIVNNEVGLWGGLTDADRIKIRRQRQREQPPGAGLFGRVPGPPPPHHSEARARWNKRHDQPPCQLCLDSAALANRLRRAAKRARQLERTRQTGTKVCGRCHVEKPVSEFNLQSTSCDGRQRQCQPCQRAAYRDWYDKSGRKQRGRSGQNSPDTTRQLGARR